MDAQRSTVPAVDLPTVSMCAQMLAPLGSAKWPNGNGLAVSDRAGEFTGKASGRRRDCSRRPPRSFDRSEDSPHLSRVPHRPPERPKAAGDVRTVWISAHVDRVGIRFLRLLLFARQRFLQLLCRDDRANVGGREIQRAGGCGWAVGRRVPGGCRGGGFGPDGGRRGGIRRRRFTAETVQRELKAGYRRGARRSRGTGMHRGLRLRWS